MSEIVDLLKQSLASNPADWNVRKAIVEKLAEEGDWEGCSEVIRSAPGAAPDADTAIRFSELVRGHDPECALQMIEGGLSADASNGALHFAKAEVLLGAGKIAEAGTHYSVAKTFDTGLANPDFERRLGEAAIAATGSGGVSGALSPAEPALSDGVEEVVAAEPEVPEEPAVVEEVVVAEEPVAVEEQVAEPAPAEPVFEEVYAEEASLHETGSGEAGSVLEVQAVEEPVPVEHIHHPVPVEELPHVRPLVDPNSVPEAPKLNAGHIAASASAMNFTPTEELMSSRSHLSVFDSEGSVIDADALDEDAWYEDQHEAHLMVAGEGYKPPASERDKTQEKLGAILTTVLVHVAIALLLWVLVISIPEPKPPEIVATTLAPNTEQNVTKKQVARQVQQKPSAPSQNVTQIITAATSAPVSAPTVDFATESDTVELGTSFGIGMGFGAGGSGTGGTFSFMGNSGSGNRVVFAVDYSASMKSQNREALMKEELAKSVARLPQGTQYQVVFFSGFAFPHDAVKDEWLKDKGSWGPRNNNLLSKMRPFGSSGRLQNEATDIKIPKYSYLDATKSNIAKSKKIIEEMPLTYGTNWEHPVIMALSIKPKPDIIFFMTDGAVGDPTKAINAITELNKKGKPAVINTTAMMEPRAARELGSLADKNGGKFTIVMQGGKVIKGAEFFGKKKK